MKKIKDFSIPFIGLKLGKHQFDYQIGKIFFHNFGYDEFDDVNIKVDLILEKKSTMLELWFSHEGTVSVPCDLTAEVFDLPIKGKIKLIVQFGEIYNNDNEELLVLPHGEHRIDISQYIYEMIVLSVPPKRIRFGAKFDSFAAGKPENQEGLLLKERQTEEEKSIDPRWDKLKQLLTDK